MKRFLRPIYAGISGQYDTKSKKYKFKVDFNDNTEDDVIKFVEPYYHRSSIDNYTYWFGYSFNDGQSNPRRDEFIEFLKHVQPENWSDPDDEWSEPVYTDDSITEPELSQMIFNSMNRIRIDERTIDAIVYPESKSGNLVSMIARIIKRAMPSRPQLKVQEVLKASPSNIQFDYDAFYEDLKNGAIYVPDFVDNEYIVHMMDKVHSSNSFSLRRNIRPVSLRPYVSGFYSSTNVEKAVSDSDCILIIDDFGTSGTTIRELIRVIRSINDYCEIYIFTLMGSKRAK